MEVFIDTKGNERGLLKLIEVSRQFGMILSWEADLETPKAERKAAEQPKAERTQPGSSFNTRGRGYPKPDNGNCSARIAMLHAIVFAKRAVAEGDLMDSDTYDLGDHEITYQALRQAFGRARKDNDVLYDDDAGYVSITDAGLEIYNWFRSKFPDIKMPNIVGLREEEDAA